MKKRAYITMTLAVDLDMVAGPWDKSTDYTDAIQRQFHSAACYDPELTVHEIIERNYDYVEGKGYVRPTVFTIVDPSPAQRLAEDNAGTWGEHHTFTPADWRMDVDNHDTRAGYWDWVQAMIEASERVDDPDYDDDGNLRPGVDHA
ncbi:hypothetical protein [Bradyrhizobium ottawaense]|uniref:Uncharacterized protein n=1 Tax=Bradyrhizobium ottawaense TaxID=931866 RepID=A0ABY0QHH7_9BRAD|nr:hypothetical protein [Bradyrhizobium ottawaense]SDK43623.1 hypothetical protein SAMN05444163_8107 [Bradyrhizobium ottawaense]